ncbi:MAG: hypothetical protein R2710_20265 [Acidimicrobiales bacterium]
MHFAAISYRLGQTTGLAGIVNDVRLALEELWGAGRRRRVRSGASRAQSAIRPALIWRRWWPPPAVSIRSTSPESP